VADLPDYQDARAGNQERHRGQRTGALGRSEYQAGTADEGTAAAQHPGRPGRGLRSAAQGDLQQEHHAGVWDEEGDEPRKAAD
jgi:hypothetical protein